MSTNNQRSTITISRLIGKAPIERIVIWCIENEISFAIDYRDLTINVLLDADAATLAKLKFQI